MLGRGLLLLFLTLYSCNPPTVRSYKLSWSYDCAAYTAPDYYEYGVYGNGVLTPLGTLSESATCDAAISRSASATGVSGVVFYVRAHSRSGEFGPAVFSVAP
jgi:hypothetical protein